MKTRVMRWAPALLIMVLGCKKKEEVVTLYQALPVVKRDIVVTSEAPGVIEPDTLVEVKSKASGEIIVMKVSSGDEVRQGDLLLQVDRRSAENTMAQATADSVVASARLENAKSQLRRSEELFKSQSLTEQELETAKLSVANARAELIRAEVNLQNARISWQDTDVRAPISGLIIEKMVERGQVISSPARDVGGGTVLLKMADLSLVQVRTLVDETDFGKIREGMQATVTVEALPNMPFQGEVFKIEPQAKVEQNVTKFPMRIRVDNSRGLLKPGMNATVLIHIDKRDSIVAVQNAALRTQQDIGSAAGVLGLTDDQLQSMLADAQKEADSARQLAMRTMEGGPAGGPPAGANGQAGKPDTGKPKNTMTTPDGRVIELPDGITEAMVRSAFTKRMSGGTLNAEEQKAMQAMQAMFRNRSGGSAARRPPANESAYQFGGNYIVFRLRAGQLSLAMVRTGLTDNDYSEVRSGLQVGDSVLALPSASLVQQQEGMRQFQNRMSGGGGLPGMRSSTTGSGGRQ